jgi:hypothetical protein
VEMLVRLSVLLALMAIVAFVDRRRHRERATKWREYGFLLLAGLIGGLVGIAIDQATATISPAYFVVGKGIPRDAFFRLQVAAYGFQVGLVAGMVIGGVFLIANNPRPGRPSLAAVRLLSNALIPFGVAVMAAPLGGMIAGSHDPLGLRTQLDFLTAEQAAGFIKVWGLHLGLYVGAAVGTALAVVRIRWLRLNPVNLEVVNRD